MVVGDLNVCHNPIDIHNPKANEGLSCYTKEERGAFTNFLNLGYKDIFRELYPHKIQYTHFMLKYKSAKANNRGRRFDYCVINSEIMDRVADVVYREDLWGSSDHMPMEVIWKVKGDSLNENDKTNKVLNDVSIQKISNRENSGSNKN